MHTLLLWSVRIASTFLTPLLVGSMMLLAKVSFLLAWLPWIALIGGIYLVVWKMDVNDDGRPGNVNKGKGGD